MLSHHRKATPADILPLLPCPPDPHAINHTPLFRILPPHSLQNACMQGVLLDDTSTDSPPIATPASSESSHLNAPSAAHSSSPSHRLSQNAGSLSQIEPGAKKNVSWANGSPDSHGAGLVDPAHFQDDDEEDDFAAWDADVEDPMAPDRPAFNRPTDGRSHTPLLAKEDRGRPSYDEGAGSVRPPHHSRRSTFRSRSPDYQAAIATRKKYTYAAFFLGISLVSFVIQTETAVYIQKTLHWDKAYCML